jgi:cytochrome P450
MPLREIRAFRRDFLGFLVQMANTYGDIAHFRFGLQPLYLVSHPDYIQEVLVTQHHSLPKTWILELARDALGNGMLTSNGEYHRRQRKLIKPVLHKHRIPDYAETMVCLADRTATDWQNGATIDMAHEMMRLTLAVVSQTLFSSDLDETATEIGQSISEMAEMYERAKSPFADQINRLPFLPSNRRFKRALGRLDAAIHRIIDRRRRSGETPDDLLTLLLAARNEEDGSPLTDQQVRDEALAVFLAGQETTSDVLAWTWYLLSQHPEAEAEFHRELDVVLDGRLPDPRDLERLAYTRNMLTETMRLYPPGYVLPRRAAEPCSVGPYTVPPGAILLTNIYRVHRDPRFYDDPERFNPNRWTQEMKQRLPRFAFCPFGGGPHACLGDYFAWADAMLLMAVLGLRWKASLIPGSPVAPRPLVNLRPRYGIPMKLTRRKDR